MLILISVPLLSVTLALLYLAVAPPKFVADAVLLVEPKRADPTLSLGDTGSAASIMDSQVEILKSEKIALSIIHNLQLAKDPEFVGYGHGLIGQVRERISRILASGPDTDFSLMRRALERFNRKLTVKRVGLSYAISIQFESLHPERAAEIANAVARAYAADQIEASYDSEHATTKWLEDRVDALRTKASDAQKAVAERRATQPSTDHAQLDLRELEIAAQAYKRLYDTFLQRYLDSTEQQSSHVSQGRLVTVASPPTRPSSPKGFLVLVASVAGGIFAGIGLALLRDVSDQTLRTRDKVQAELHADCIGIIPMAIADGPVSRPPDPKANPTQAKSRTIACADSLMRNITHAPRCHFSESFRAVRLAVDKMTRGGKRLQVIGVTSALTGEGKSTVAASLAQLMAQGGGRTILLDCDLRNPSLSSLLAPDAALGMLDVTSGRAKLDDATWIDPITGLHFLPATDSSRLYTSEVLASKEVITLFKTLRETYEYVIVDLSTIAPYVDVRAAVHLMDSFVLVIEWGRTNIEVVKKSLDLAGDVDGNLVGVALNKANANALKRYGEAFDSYPVHRSEKQGSCK